MHGTRARRVPSESKSHKLNHTSTHAHTHTHTHTKKNTHTYTHTWRSCSAQNAKAFVAAQHLGSTQSSVEGPGTDYCCRLLLLMQELLLMTMAKLGRLPILRVEVVKWQGVGQGQLLVCE